MLMSKFTHWLLSMLAVITAFPSVAATFVGDRTDFRDETIYFAMTTRFYDGDPKNNVLCWDGQADQIKNNDPCWRGDFAGLIEKLPYIKALGFTAVWITPVVQNASGFDYHGYHAMDFSKVDLRYESRTDWGSDKDVKFQDLITAAHDLDMKIILDIVLQHTGNFGEDKLCHLFDRHQDIRNQAKIEACLLPDQEKLGGSSYWDLDPDTQQYPTRFKYMKNTDGQNHDSNNYWHHVANAWNWDDPTRWWGQIAGDCVDLNTENPAVVDYLVECYGEFIKMGVDGFRIDTTGHIAPLTFNAAFIPKFIELGEKYKSSRKGDAPFYMFGECCARFGSVIYRDQHLLSSHYYTWKSDPKLVEEWKQYDADWWASQNVPEGAAPLGNMLTCAKDPGTVHNSENVFMKNGAWHDPDYSQASGFNVIDFPMHYNFNDAGSAVRIAQEGDKYYNDASWNVVYVDSHDYCPGPNDLIRFNGGTQQWAENLSLMFTFRGIPCIYYGSEVEFQKGKTIDKGPLLALAESGRAYFGEYLKGTVKADDFGVFTASGNVEKTLNGDLSQHIIRLNQIRAAVPALRKGQYTFDGCKASSGWAFKRAYKDSYALVAINGGATFTSVPAGTYVDLVTGDSFTPSNGSITVNAPSGKGQLRVLVKDWKGGKVGTDGKFIYKTSPVAHGGSVNFSDPGTTEYYTKESVVGDPSVKFSPAGGSFKTDTQTVSVSLNEVATSGWYQVEGGQKVTLAAGQTKTFVVGQNMVYGESVKVTWGATDGKSEYTGSVTYKKVDPNATITVYVKAPAGSCMYAWGKDESGKEIYPCGTWPGKTLSESTTVDGQEYYYVTFDGLESVNVIFNCGGNQTGNIEGITEDVFYEYDGGSSAKKLDVSTTPVPSVKFSPNGGNFVDNVTVNVTVSNATSAWYKIGSGSQTTISGNSATFTLGDDMSVGESVVVTWSASNGTETKTGSVTFRKIEEPVLPEGITVYYDNSITNWSTVKIHYWGGEEASSWPGVDMMPTQDNAKIFMYVLPLGTTGVVFNNGNGDQTDDVIPVDHHLYKGTGGRGFSDEGYYTTSVISIEADGAELPVEYFNMQGIRVNNPTPGFYIMRRGNKVEKVYVH